MGSTSTPRRRAGGTGHRPLAATVLVTLTLLVTALGGLAVGGLALAAPATAAPTQSSLCDASTGARYNGTSSERDLVAAKVDPSKVVNSPCPYDATVRGIRLDTDSVQLVAGGQLRRTIALAPASGGAFTLQQIIAAIGDPAWATLSGTTAELKASLVQEPGTHLVVAAPAVTLVRLDDTAGGTVASIVGDAAFADFTGVTVTSWDSTTGAPQHYYKDYSSTPSVHGGADYSGRSFIVYKNGSMLDFTRSTCRWLGSDQTSSYGVAWRLDTPGLVTGSTFEHSFFGVYTYETKDVVFEHSTFRHNVWYGLDPHTGSSHLTVRDDDVYGNGHHGIVFSRYVTDSLVEGNHSHDNAANGIMMDFRSDRNTIRDNTVDHNGQGIVFSGSARGVVEGNTVTDNGVGLRASHDGADGIRFSGNTVTGGRVGVQLYGGASTAAVVGNTLTGQREYGAIIDAPRTTLTGNTITGARTGVRLETVATVSGGSIAASKTAVQADDESFATVRGVRVVRGDPVRTSPEAVVSLLGTAYRLPRVAGSVSALDVAGLGVLLFALACEVVHLSRRRGLRRVNAAYAVPAGGGRPEGALPAPHASRMLLRTATPVAVLSAPAAAAGAGQLVREAPTAPDERSRRFRPDVEGLRALAVLAVVLADAGLGLRGGFVGVDVFFVLSGFLLTGQLLAEAGARGRPSLLRFYARRIRRVLPATALVLVVTLVAVLLAEPASQRSAMAGDGLAAALGVLDWRLAHRATSASAHDLTSPFEHFWALSAGAQLTVVLPLLLVGVLLLARGRARRWALAAVLVAAAAASLVVSLVQTPTDEPYAYFGAHTRVLDVALGALVALGASRLRATTRSLARLVGWGGLAALALAAAAFSELTRYPGAAVLLPVLGAVAVLVAGTSADGAGHGVERLLGWAPLRWVGRASFSLYLWHWPLLVVLPAVLGHPLSVPQRIVAVLLAVLLATITYDVVEQPLRHRRSLVARPARAFVLGAALVAACVTVALVVLAAGHLSAPEAPATTPAVSSALTVGG